MRGNVFLSRVKMFIINMVVWALLMMIVNYRFHNLVLDSTLSALFVLCGIMLLMYVFVGLIYLSTFMFIVSPNTQSNTKMQP